MNCWYQPPCWLETQIAQQILPGTFSLLIVTKMKKTKKQGKKNLQLLQLSADIYVFNERADKQNESLPCQK